MRWKAQKHDKAAWWGAQVGRAMHSSGLGHHMMGEQAAYGRRQLGNEAQRAVHASNLPEGFPRLNQGHGFGPSMPRRPCPISPCKVRSNHQRRIQQLLSAECCSIGLRTCVACIASVQSASAESRPSPKHVQILERYWCLHSRKLMAFANACCALLAGSILA